MTVYPARRRLPAVIALALALAGCTGRGGGSGAAPTETVVLPEPPVAQPAPPRRVPPDVARPDSEPELRQLVPDAVDVVARPWEEAFVLEEGRTVELRYWSGPPPCSVPARVEVDAGGDAVTLTLFEGREPSDEPVGCAEIGVYTAVRVSLDRSVGQRSLVDGAR